LSLGRASMGARPSFSTFLTSTPAASRCLPLSPARSSTFCGRIHDFPDYLDPRAIFPEIFSEVTTFQQPIPTADAVTAAPIATFRSSPNRTVENSTPAPLVKLRKDAESLTWLGWCGPANSLDHCSDPPASPIAGLKACPSKLFLLLLTQLGAYRTATNLSWAIWHKCTSALYALFQLDFFDDDTATFWACPPLKRVAFVGHLLWLPPFIERTSSAMQEHRDIFEMICCVFRDCVRFRKQVGK